MKTNKFSLDLVPVQLHFSVVLRTKVKLTYKILPKKLFSSSLQAEPL